MFFGYFVCVIVKMDSPQNGPRKQTPEQSSSGDESPVDLYFISNLTVLLSSTCCLYRATAAVFLLKYVSAVKSCYYDGI